VIGFVGMATNFASLVSEASPDLFAPERWSVEKKRRDWDQEISEFREKQRKQLKYIRHSSQKKVIRLQLVKSSSTFNISEISLGVL
jgi:hypothetical protein